MARFLHKLASAGTRTLGTLSASARPAAPKPSEALPELIEEHVAAGAPVPVPPAPSSREEPEAFRVEAPRSAPLESARAPGMEAPLPPVPASVRVPSPSLLGAASVTAVDVSSTRSAGPEPTAAARSESPGTPRSLRRTVSLRDADIRVAEPGSVPGMPRQGAPQPVAPSLQQTVETGDLPKLPADPLAPLKAQWRELAQRLRVSHPPPLPEAVAAEVPAPPPLRPAEPRAQTRAESAPTAGPAAAAASSRSPSSPALAATTVTFSPATEPLRRPSEPSQSPSARAPERAPELVIGNLEIRVVPMTSPTPQQAPAPAPAPHSPSSGSWQSSTRRFLGRW